jgi:hypothetical protein
MSKIFVIIILILLPFVATKIIADKKRKDDEDYILAKNEIISILRKFYVSGDFKNLANDISKQDSEDEKTDILIRKAIYIKTELENGMIGSKKIPDEIWLKLKSDLTTTILGIK